MVEKTEPSTNHASWDLFVQANRGHLLQLSRWGALKQAFGWRYEVLPAVDQGGQIQSGALLLFRKLPLGLGSIAYIPRGPVADWSNPGQFESLLAAIDKLARQNRSILLKIEPDIADSPANRQQLQVLAFRESVQTVQPPNTIIINLEGPEGDLEGDNDEVLMRMSSSTRRKIRVAYRSGITVREGERGDLDTFCRMMQTTSERNQFGAHSPAYFQTVYDHFVPEHAALLMTSYQDEDVAGLFVFSLGHRSWYFYGASSNTARSLMPTYALQWEAIRWARRRGCLTYDLWGIPDAPEETLEAQFKERSDGLWGVYGFKRGFGGRVYRTVGAWDRVYNPLLYRLYTFFIRRMS
nr:peptidoglycan bridge formation glycyltransferase FemA/FemB family protein [Anaerolineae bacterium]